MNDTASLDAPRVQPVPRFWEGLRLARAYRPLVSLADQASVSGANFATTMIVGRFCAEGELGLYSLGFSLVLFGLCVQQSLVATPFTVFRQKIAPADEGRYAGAVLIHQAILSLLISLVLLVAAAAAHGSSFGGLLLALAAAAPCVLLREFVRRFLFARFEVGRAMLIDLLVVLLQLGALAALATTQSLSAWSAHLAAGSAALAAAAVWFFFGHFPFVFDVERARQESGRSWSLGRWVLAGNTASLGHAYAMHWTLLAMMGAAATGLFAACATVVDFSNLVVLGLSNFSAPHLARALADRGVAALRREVLFFTLQLGGFMAAFCLAAALFGEQALVLLFGPSYAGHGLIVLMLALATFTTSLGIGPTNGLLAVEKSHLNFIAGVLGLSVSLAAALVLIPILGTLGAATAALAGAAVATATRISVFCHATRASTRASAPEAT